MKTLMQWLRLSLVYFFLIALMGVGLRLYALYDIELTPFRYLLHAHSHLAMMGWVFNALLIGAFIAFMPSGWADQGKTRTLFWLLQICVVAMAVAFMFQGYGAVSISFSTLHIVLSYALVFQLFKTLTTLKPTLSKRLMIWALVFLLTSSLGPWALAIIGANGYGGTPIYKAAIYWFLHFTYNGWMTCGLLALLTKHFAIAGGSRGKLIVGLLVTAIFGTYTLSLLEFSLPGSLHFVGALLGMVQLTVILWIATQLWLRSENLSGKWLIGVALGALCAKGLLQVLSALPMLQTLVFFTRDTVVLYLHLVLIGWITFGILYYFRQVTTLNGKTGLLLLASGFILQEVVLSCRIVQQDLLEPTVWAWMLLTAAVVMALGALSLLRHSYALDLNLTRAFTYKS